MFLKTETFFNFTGEKNPNQTSLSSNVRVRWVTEYCHVKMYLSTCFLWTPTPQMFHKLIDTWTDGHSKGSSTLNTCIDWNRISRLWDVPLGPTDTQRTSATFCCSELNLNSGPINGTLTAAAAGSTHTVPVTHRVTVRRTDGSAPGWSRTLIRSDGHFVASDGLDGEVLLPPWEMRSLR